MFADSGNAFDLLSFRATRGSSTVSRSPFEREGARIQSDLDYFRGRAREEIDASLSAQSTVARKAHLELAHRYSERAEAIERSGWPYRDPSQG
jgi:hypothetical protein